MAEKHKHGGSRPGAGRPEGTLQPQTIEKNLLRERLRQKVAQEFDPLIDAQVANAKGIKYLVARDKQGKFSRITEDELKKILDGDDPDRVAIEVWDKDPSVQAFTDLMNRAIDKPIEPIEHSGAVAMDIRWQDDSK